MLSGSKALPAGERACSWGACTWCQTQKENIVNAVTWGRRTECEDVGPLAAMWRGVCDCSGLRAAVACGLVALSVSSATAGAYNPDRSIGDVVPAWQGLPGTDGKEHGWDELADRDFVVVVFTCNSCPYAVDYEARVNSLAKKYAGAESRVAVVAINANLIAEDAPAAMEKRAADRGFVFPYLFDESQEVPKSFGALRTPEAYLLNRKREILYMGAIDDNTDASKVEKTYLADAITASLAGKPVAEAETPPVGCLIRFKRRRR